MTKVDTLKLCQDRLAQAQAQILEHAASDQDFFEMLTNPGTRGAVFEGADDVVTEEIHALVADPRYVCGFLVGMMSASDQCGDAGRPDLEYGFFLTGAVLSDLHAQATGTKIPSVG